MRMLYIFQIVILGLLLLLSSCAEHVVRSTYPSPNVPLIIQDVKAGKRGRLPDPREEELASIIAFENQSCQEYQAHRSASPNSSKCKQLQSAAENLDTVATIVGYIPGAGALASFGRKASQYSSLAANVYCAFNPEDTQRSQNAWSGVLSAFVSFAAKNPDLVRANPRATKMLGYANSVISDSSGNAAKTVAEKECSDMRAGQPVSAR